VVLCAPTRETTNSVTLAMAVDSPGAAADLAGATTQVTKRAGSTRASRYVTVAVDTTAVAHGMAVDYSLLAMYDSMRATDTTRDLACDTMKAKAFRAREWVNPADTSAGYEEVKLSPLSGLDPPFWLRSISPGDTTSIEMGGNTYWLSHRSASYPDYLMTLMWDGCEIRDTRHPQAPNPTARAYHGFAWNDTGIHGGVGFAGIWQYDSTRVMAMAETADAGTKSFVMVNGSTGGAWSDTCLMSSEKGFYTNRSCVAHTLNGQHLALPGGITVDSVTIGIDTSKLYLWFDGKRFAATRE